MDDFSGAGTTIATDQQNQKNNNNNNNTNPTFDTLKIDEDGEQQQQALPALPHQEKESPNNHLHRKTHMSELAHKTDQFFRNDMRSVAARVQLNHGTFVFMNSKKKKVPTSSENNLKYSSLKKEENRNNNSNKDQTSSSYIITPGTKLIQTWIRRVERPKPV